ncbi:MAG: hypothetical protein KGL50_10120 [Burkholderiales bacterium]|nr:hypothetical protein [Burkholderiales bacterium]
MIRVLPSRCLALAVLLAGTAVSAQAQGAASEPVTTKIAHEVSHVAHVAASGVERGAKAAAHGGEVGAHAAASGVRRGARAVAHGVEVGANATARVAKRVESHVAASSAGHGK